MEKLKTICELSEKIGYMKATGEDETLIKGLEIAVEGLREEALKSGNVIKECCTCIYASKTLTESPCCDCMWQRKDLWKSMEGEE